MNEFIRFLLISNVALFVVWTSYKLLLQKSTFHGMNRAYLLFGSVFALLVPFLPVSQASVGIAQGLELPAITVGENIAAGFPIEWKLNWFIYVYVLGALFMLWHFVKGVSSMVRLLNQAKSEVIEGELVFRSDLAGPFSFLSIIHLPDKLSSSNKQTIFRHELAHVRLGHSYDVLWFSALRILFWFNPFIGFYLRSIQEIHEYQADALTHISSSKEHYVKVQLDQLFQLPSELSFANSFYNSINLKKRVNMIYSEKSSKWGSMRYLVAIPLVAVIGLMAACTETPPEAIQEEAEKVYKVTDVMPEFPGGMSELAQFLGATIKYPESAEKDGIEGRVYVQFIVNEEGHVLKAIPTNSVREDLDKEAVRAVLEMPKWKPGMKDGKPVSVEMTLPIVFKLD